MASARAVRQPDDRRGRRSTGPARRCSRRASRPAGCTWIRCGPGVEDLIDTITAGLRSACSLRRARTWPSSTSGRSSACRARPVTPRAARCTRAGESPWHTSIGTASPSADRRWLMAALGVITGFMIGEVIAGFAAHSLALSTDAGAHAHRRSALLVAVVSAVIARRPARGAYTYGFARVDALSGQANGITLLVLAVLFEVQAMRRPGRIRAGPRRRGHGRRGDRRLVNVVATVPGAQADRESLNVRGAVTHLVTDAWAFAATFAAGLVRAEPGWQRPTPSRRCSSAR